MMHWQNRRSSGAISTALRWCLLTTAALYATKPTAVSAEDVDVFFARDETEAISAQCENLDYVTGPLYASDADGNGVLSQDEFVVFTNTVSGGWLEDMGLATRFTDMPLVLQEANVVLQCLCELYSTEDWGKPGCCDNTATSGIRTAGSGPDEKPDDVELEYLTYVCGTMSETLGRLNAQLVAPPSSSPSAHPSASPSMSPTMKPTLQPTLAPVTASPTVSPSQSPTTSSPTGKPSLTPTLSPVTESPTMSPIEPGSPTKSPEATPSTTPSVAPTTSAPITSAPTASPIATPSSVPSVTSFSGDFTLSVNFAQYLDGQITADAISKGETNQVKETMEEALLVLANLVIQELNNGARRELMLRRRELLVKEATDATVTGVQDIRKF